MNRSRANGTGSTLAVLSHLHSHADLENAIKPVQMGPKVLLLHAGEAKRVVSEQGKMGEVAHVAPPVKMTPP